MALKWWIAIQSQEISPILGKQNDSSAIFRNMLNLFESISEILLSGLELRQV